MADINMTLREGFKEEEKNNNLITRKPFEYKNDSAIYDLANKYLIAEREIFDEARNKITDNPVNINFISDLDTEMYYKLCRKKIENMKYNTKYHYYSYNDSYRAHEKHTREIFQKNTGLKLTDKEFDILDNYKYFVVENEEKWKYFWDVIIVIFGILYIFSYIVLTVVFKMYNVKDDIACRILFTYVVITILIGVLCQYHYDSYQTSIKIKRE